jgi:hypothetical protein
VVESSATCARGNDEHYSDRGFNRTPAARGRRLPAQELEAFVAQVLALRPGVAPHLSQQETTLLRQINARLLPTSSFGLTNASPSGKLSNPPDELHETIGVTSDQRHDAQRPQPWATVCLRLRPS